MDILSMMQKLDACHGISGNEKAISAVLSELAAPYVDECTTDVLGNLICRKKGRGPKVMFAAHMDSIGLMVTHIGEEGFLRVGTVGGVRPANILHSMVRFSNGTLGAVSTQAEDLSKLKADDLYLDIGAKDRAEAERLVSIGDTAAYVGDVVPMGNRLVSPYLDDRIGCLVLLMAMEQIKESSNDLYFVFTVQEEVGLRGAKPAAYGIDPDYGIAVDVTGSDDTPGSKHGCSAKLGGGAGVKVMDASVICHPEMVKRLNQLAREQDISVQPDVPRTGGTDAGAIHISRVGVLTGGISIPCRYIHSPAEMVERSDVEACARLAAAFAMSGLPEI